MISNLQRILKHILYIFYSIMFPFSIFIFKSELDFDLDSQDKNADLYGIYMVYCRPV